MLPGSGAGATTGQTGVGLPSSARAPADVAPSGTVVGLGRFVVGLGRFVEGDCFGPVVDDFFGLAVLAELDVTGLGATLDVSCDALDDADNENREISSAKVWRGFELLVNTSRDWRREGLRRLSI